MSTPSIECLSLERVAELREVLLPLFERSCDGNEITRDNLTPEEVLDTVMDGDAVAFLYCEDGEPTLTLVFQFYEEGSQKCADILAMAGKNLSNFRRYYWQDILDWLRANQIKYLDAFVDGRRAKMYQSRFGFGMTCALVRMDLMEA